MHEGRCFSMKCLSSNVDDLPLPCDGCETFSCVVGSFSDHGRIIPGSISDHGRIGPALLMGFKCFSCMCGRENSIVICNSTIVPAMCMGLQGVLVAELPMVCAGSLARIAVLEREQMHESRYFSTKVCPRTSMISLCRAMGARRSRVWSDHSRIIPGSFPDHGRIMVGSVPHC